MKLRAETASHSDNIDAAAADDDDDDGEAE